MRAALVVLLTVLSLLASTALAGAATTLHATLSGKKEVPKAGNGTGTARLTLDAKKGRVCFRIKLRHVGTAMMGHIHKGGKTTAGPITIPLFARRPGSRRAARARARRRSGRSSGSPGGTT